jgi:uncharacterized membrane protein
MSQDARSWLVPAGLVALGAVPVVAGSLRLVQLSGGAATLPPDARYDASPLPVVVHIVCGTVFAVLGAFQFAPVLRRRHPAWHRRAGRVLVVAGTGVALSALWLNQFVPNQAAAREVLYPVRAAFGVGLIVAIALGFRAIRRGDITGHRAWMVRSYAIGLVAGTQVLTLALGGAVLGTGELATALLMVSAWAVNLAVAEVAIRRGTGGAGRTRRPRTAVAVPS